MLLDTPKNDDGQDSVNASYSRISEAFRHATAGPRQCQVNRLSLTFVKEDM